MGVRWKIVRCNIENMKEYRYEKRNYNPKLE